MAAAKSTGLNKNTSGALAYVLGPITGVIFLVIDKDPFVRFHAMQSLFVFGGLFVANMILALIPILGWMIGMLLSPAALILWVFLMWKAWSGEEYKLPYVGEMAEKQLAKMS